MSQQHFSPLKSTLPDFIIVIPDFVCACAERGVFSQCIFHPLTFTFLYFCILRVSLISNGQLSSVLFFSLRMFYISWRVQPFILKQLIYLDVNMPLHYLISICLTMSEFLFLAFHLNRMRLFFFYILPVSLIVVHYFTLLYQQLAHSLCFLQVNMNCFIYHFSDNEKTLEHFIPFIILPT